MENKDVIKFLRLQKDMFDEHRVHFFRYYWDNSRQLPKLLHDESIADSKAFERVIKILEHCPANWAV